MDERLLSLVRRSQVVVVVGDVKLKLKQVQVLHALIIVSEEWSYYKLAQYCERRYGGGWDKVKVFRAVTVLRRNGLVESVGFDTERAAVAVVAEKKRHNPSTGKLWSEMYDSLKGYDLGLHELREELRRVFS